MLLFAYAALALQFQDGRIGHDRILRPAAPFAGEWFNFPANSNLMQQLPNLGNKPLIVLTRDPKGTTPEGPIPSQWWLLTDPVWQQLQVELAGLSTNSQHRVVEHAGHNIQFEQPQVVADAILDVVGQVRAQLRP
jgi:pimeloyl-ACP methyl ester carboxylesterase